MKIGFLTERMILGYGVDLVTDRLAEGLSGMGHEVTVCCSFHDETYLGGSYKLETVPISVPRSRSASEYESRAEKAIRLFVEREDLWIVESFPFFKAASRFEKPWIAVDHGVVPSESFPWRIRRHFDYIRRTQYGEYFQKSSKIVCVSHFIRHKLPPALQDKAVVIHPGIDHYANNSLVDLKAELGLDGVIILYLGRSTAPYKGVDMLLKTCSKLRSEGEDVRLLISTSCTLEEQARLENAGATVLNGVLPPFVPSVYQCGDIFATATQWEGFDLPLLEASYFGLPVVAFAIGAHPEIVQNGQTGYLVRDEREFLDRLRALAGDSLLRSRIGKKGAAFAHAFRWKDVVEGFEKVIRETAEEASSKH